MTWMVTGTQQVSTLSLRTRPRTLNILFRQASEMSPEAAVDHLRRNNHSGLRIYLRYLLDDKIQFLARPGDYDGTSDEEALSLFESARRLYLFANDPDRQSPVANNPVKMQKLFDNFLSEIHASEIPLVLRLIPKTLPEGLSREVLLQAFPDLLVVNEAERHRQNMRRNTEKALMQAIQERDRMRRLYSDEQSALSEIAAAKRKLKEDAEAKVRELERILGTLR